MSWSIEIDANTCIGSGMCAGVAPDHFELVEGYSTALQDRTEPSDDVVDAAESCPVEAILVKDVETGKVVAPEE
ncbi:ferredoxin [Saccharopolyspora sp. TS4A08]|uniref:Ferredoxin n=2 Tax=Saccharopolyspora TaxID=1835 RepID=A0A1I6TX90_9PSEU|nr:MULTISPECIES: ferredoxin [Saccharopolyspora]MDI2030797.1 ferredoxin [Saccharopolyspora sp. TS4A08]SFS93843.1 ferredoxin [Saccharopolyspora flava]